MKKLTILLLTVVITFGAVSTASAQFFMSRMADARSLGADGIRFGGGISIFKDMLGLGGTIRIGVTDDLELGGKLGFINIDAEGGDDHTGLSVGADINYQFLDVKYGDPVDLSTGGGIEYYNMPGDATFLMIGSNTLVSYPITFESGQVLSPMFRLNLRFDRASMNDNSDTDFNIGFGLGMQFDVNDFLSFFAEVLIPGGNLDEGFVAGVSFAF